VRSSLALPERRRETGRSRTVSEPDPTGLRNSAMDAFLDGKLREGYEIETRRDTHAIIAKHSLKNLLRGRSRTSRYVVSVDEHGQVTEVPAEPVRS
jgi:hypothetical protein